MDSGRSRTDLRGPALGTLSVPLRVFLVMALVATLFASASATTAQAAGEPVVRGSVGQVYVTGATPGATLVLRNAAGERVDTTTVNRLGGALFYEVRPGTGYRVKQEGGTYSDPVTVHTAR